MLKNIAVFCGSAHRYPDIYRIAAEAVGRALARQGRRLIYGSGDWGLMGVLAKAVQAEGGHVTGVNVKQFQDVPSTVVCDEYAVADTMQDRKVALIARADACIAIPGGMGTLDELTEMYVQAQIGVFDKPFGLLNVDHYFDGFLMQLRRANQDGFVSDFDFARLQTAEDIETLLDLLDRYAEKRAAQ